MQKLECRLKKESFFAGLLAVWGVCFPLGINCYGACREWEQWDKGSVSQEIDRYWRSSPQEKMHRALIASFIKPYFHEGDLFLEVGCGSGLIYEQLVSHIIRNDAYTGGDISENMLEIARKRFPFGKFFKGDLYQLPFPDESFQVVAAFEVFGHIGDIEQPIREMFRVSSRKLMFTVWTGLCTKIEQEKIEDAVFIHKTFSEEDVVATIKQALFREKYTLHTRSLSEGVCAFIIIKK